MLLLYTSRKKRKKKNKPMIFQKLFNSLAIAACVMVVNSCSVNKAKIDNNLKKYFDAKNVDGCFTMLNNSDGSVTVYNMALDTMRLTPASTFKIPNSLIALQTGVAVNDSMVIKWDGIKRWNDEWNKDMNMREAFKTSNVAYYQEIARR